MFLAPTWICPFKIKAGILIRAGLERVALKRCIELSLVILISCLISLSLGKSATNQEKTVSIANAAVPSGSSPDTDPWARALAIVTGDSLSDFIVNGLTNPAASASQQVTALQFPGDDYVNRSFRRTLQQGLPNPYPLTVIWQAWVENKSPQFYQTCWFFGPRDYLNGGQGYYYGCCPYPYIPGGLPDPNGTLRWEIAARADDIIGDAIEIGRWYTCGFTAWKDGSGSHHRFYFDLPNTAKLISKDLELSYFPTLMPDQEFCWGDAQWDHVRNGSGKEQLRGRMRRFKIIQAQLSLSDLVQEAVSDEIVTSVANANIWYYNPNPRPDDLLDKSGRGNHFSWYDPSQTASLWTETSTSVATPTISPNGGSFSGSVQVSFTCATSGAEIRYTTNGVTPTASSTLYSAPFALTSTATVKALGLKSGMTNSAIASAAFIVSIKGDLNQDNRVDVLDLQLCVNCILAGTSCPNADVNQDGSVNVLDLQMIINIILQFSP